MPEKKRKKWKTALIVIAGLLAALCVAFFVYTSDYYHAAPKAMQAFGGRDGVSVTQNAGMITFVPERTSAHAGLAFYPGGKVEWTAYAPLMRAIARKGAVCVLLKMPFNLAVFDTGAAERAIAAHPDVKSWYVGGHSLGGSMAAAWCASHADKCKGLVLLGSYSASDLSKTDLKALVLVGTQDHVLNRAALESSKAKMPNSTVYQDIEGGNHGHFGNYGEQAGDGKAAISAELQQEETADAVAALMGLPQS